MQPAQFQDVVLSVITALPQTEAAATFADAGWTRSRWGVVMRPVGGGEVWWQIVMTFSTDQPPVTGPDPAAYTARTPPPGNFLAAVEEAMCAGLSTGCGGQAASVYGYSGRERPAAMGYGAGVEFRNGARGFVQLAHALRPARNRAG